MLAKREAEQARQGSVCGVLHRQESPTDDLLRNDCRERGPQGGIGEGGQRAGHFVQAPNATEVA